MYLITLRQRRNWTQEELCERSKVAQNTISRLERDPRARPTIVTVKQLGKALKVNPLSIRFGPVPVRNPAESRA